MLRESLQKGHQQVIYQDGRERHPSQFFTATILEWKHLLKPDKYNYIIFANLHFSSAPKRIPVLRKRKHRMGIFKKI